MKTYSIGSPPKVPGIYLLLNQKSGHAYVGQAKNLHRRWAEWRWTFSLGGVHARNKEMLRAIATTDIDDWEFAVLHEAADDQDLNVLEKHAIQHVANARPASLLNRFRYAEKVIGVGNIPKTRLKWPDGLSMTQVTAAAALGVTPQTVKKRLAELRKRGIVEVTISGEPPKMIY